MRRRKKGIILHELVLFSLYRPRWKTLWIFFFVIVSVESTVWGLSAIAEQQEQEMVKEVQHVQHYYENDDGGSSSCCSRSRLFLRNGGRNALARTKMIQRGREVQDVTDCLFFYNGNDDNDDDDDKNNHTDEKCDYIAWWREQNILVKKKKRSGEAGGAEKKKKMKTAEVEVEAGIGTSVRKKLLFLRSFVSDWMKSIKGVRWNHHDNNNHNKSNRHHPHHSNNNNSMDRHQNTNSSHLPSLIPLRTLWVFRQELFNNSINNKNNSNNIISSFSTTGSNTPSAEKWGIIGVCVAFGLFTIFIMIRVVRRWRRVQQVLREEEVEEREGRRGSGGGGRNHEEEEEHQQQGQYQHLDQEDRKETTWFQGKDWCGEETKGDYFYHQFYYQQETEKEVQAREWRRRRSFLFFLSPENNQREEGSEKVPPNQIRGEAEAEVEENLSYIRWSRWNRSGRTSLHERESPRIVTPLREEQEEEEAGEKEGEKRTREIMNPKIEGPEEGRSTHMRMMVRKQAEEVEERIKMVLRGSSSSSLSSSLSWPSLPYGVHRDPTSISVLQPQQMEGEMLERRSSTSSRGIRSAWMSKEQGGEGKNEEEKEKKKKMEEGQQEEEEKENHHHNKDENREEEEEEGLEEEEGGKSIRSNKNSTTHHHHPHQNNNNSNHNNHHNQPRQLSERDKHAASPPSTMSPPSTGAFPSSFSVSQSICFSSPLREHTSVVTDDGMHQLLTSSILSPGDGSGGGGGGSPSNAFHLPLRGPSFYLSPTTPFSPRDEDVDEEKQEDEED